MYSTTPCWDSVPVDGRVFGVPYLFHHYDRIRVSTQYLKYPVIADSPESINLIWIARPNLHEFNAFYVGIDVAKASLVVKSSMEQLGVFDNNKRVIKYSVRSYASLPVTTVACP